MYGLQGFGDSICTQVDPSTGQCTAAEDASTLQPVSPTGANISANVASLNQWAQANPVLALGGGFLLVMLLQEFIPGRRR